MTDDSNSNEEFTVTPYTVEGTIDYNKLLNQFGAEPLTEDQYNGFPEPIHHLVRRKIFYAGRDVDSFLSALTTDRQHSIVTGRGPSGPMHIGHIIPLYFAKYLQEQTGATVYIPISDDEKYMLKENKSLQSIQDYTRQNIREILAIGFDPSRTRIIIDTADADIIYPLSMTFATELTQATIESTYGEPSNIGMSFYPAVQITHLLLPQLVYGSHPSLVPIAIDQDPHLRLSRDVAAKSKYDIKKPSTLLSKFLPNLNGPGKMSSSGSNPSILLTDDPTTVREKIMSHAYSGGRSNIQEHREHGGNPDIDVPFQYLRYFFEPDDTRLETIERKYRSGDLLSGELKELTASKIAEFLETHQARKSILDDVETELEQYRLTRTERQSALARVGFSTELQL